MAIFDQKLSIGLKGRKADIKVPLKTSKVRFWIHCASLGEFEQGKPIIEKLKRNIDAEIILSFFSPSGFEVKKNYALADSVCYIPFDTKRNVKKFINKIDPDVVIFVKYEFWWNMIKGLLDRNIPLIFISTSFGTNHYIFKKWARSFRSLLQKVEHLFVIDQESFNNLKDYNFENASLSGDTRIESIINRKAEKGTLEIIKEFKGENPLLIFGSTYPSEHKEIIKFADDLVENFQVLIFPHELNAKEINDLNNSLGKKCQLYSEIENNHPFTGYNILIVDKIGILAEAYQYADIACVGGGFDHGIHNILEPFVFKIPILFGPQHLKFSEATYLSKFEFVGAIEELSEIKHTIEEIYRHRESEEIAEAFNYLFGENLHVSERIIKYITSNLMKT